MIIDLLIALPLLVASVWMLAILAAPDKRTRIGARQDDMDALTIKLFHLRASLRPKARVAAAKMEQWHRDPASDGRGGEVVRLVRLRRLGRHGC